jgi:hypothetical protein
VNNEPVGTVAVDLIVAAALSGGAAMSVATDAISGMENPLKDAMYSAGSRMKNRQASLP